MAPLAVCVGENVPQEPAGAQDQSTPPFEEESLVTVAATGAVWLTLRPEGGAVVMEIEIGSAAMLTAAVAVFVGSATDVAVMVTDAAEAGAV